MDNKYQLNDDDLAQASGGGKLIDFKKSMYGLGYREQTEVINTEDCIHLDDSGDCTGFGG